MKKKCIVCSSELESNADVFQVKEMMFGTRDVFTYYCCFNCGTLQIKDIPQSMASYYPSGYYSYNNKGKASLMKRVFLKRRNKHLARKFDLIGACFKLIRNDIELENLGEYLNSRDSILDVGCGDGKLLRKLDVAGFERLLGIDPFNEVDFKERENFEILKKEIYSVEEKFDVIMFNHSFEHMTKPMTVLNKAKSLLKKDGRIIIRIPTTSSFAWKEYRENWVQLDAPRHLYLYSRLAVEIMAESCGLKVIDTKYDSDEFQFIGSEQYVNGIPLFDEGSYYPELKENIVTPSKRKEYIDRARVLNENKLGDQAIFVLSEK